MSLTCGLWTLIGPVAWCIIPSWCRRWTGSAIYQQVNLSKLQQLCAAGANYQGVTSNVDIFTALVHSRLLHIDILKYSHQQKLFGCLSRRSDVETKMCSKGDRLADNRVKHDTIRIDGGINLPPLDQTRQQSASHHRLAGAQVIPCLYCKKRENRIQIWCFLLISSSLSTKMLLKNIKNLLRSFDIFPKMESRCYPSNKKQIWICFSTSGA